MNGGREAGDIASSADNMWKPCSVVHAVDKRAWQGPFVRTWLIFQLADVFYAHTTKNVLSGLISLPSFPDVSMEIAAVLVVWLLAVSSPWQIMMVCGSNDLQICAHKYRFGVIIV